MKKVFDVIWLILAMIYAPLFIASWIIHKIARLLLAVAYFGMFEMQMAKDIVLNLFKWHGKH